MKTKNYLFNNEASVLWGSTKDVKRGNPKNRRKKRKMPSRHKTIDYGVTRRGINLKFEKRAIF